MHTRHAVIKPEITDEVKIKERRIPNADGTQKSGRNNLCTA